ncbi:MAG: metalloregulator ArsR/SmtB family transcription factor [Anaerolineaceae bacterium]|nr:metalloregulator ArsR/SmtB family transcription factor [Anaerolineaceae bacterium]
MNQTPSEIYPILKAMADENRLRILSLLSPGQLCACQILENLQIRQSTLSHHMQVLGQAGLVESWSVGKWTHYRLSPQNMRVVNNFMQGLLAAAANQQAIQADCACERQGAEAKR